MKRGVIDLTGDSDGEPEPTSSVRRVRTASMVSSVSEEGEGVEGVEVLPEETEADEALGFAHDKIVGVRYYAGVVLEGEKVRLVREPHNAYDPNAIQAMNIAGVQVGHIPRTTASIVAALIDRGALRVEGIVATKPRPGAASVPIVLSFYLRQQGARAEVTSRLAALRLRPAITQTSTGASASTSGGLNANSVTPMQEWERILKAGGSMTHQASSALVEKLVMSEKDLEKMPEAPQPSNVLTQLLPYQKQGLHWMMSAEHPLPPEGEKPCQFWIFDKKQKHYKNICTTSAQKQIALARGGILADDMGLGKTLQIISLICSDPSGMPVVSKPVPSERDGSKTTLIICPLSVMSNWVTQIKQHTRKDSVSVHVFHGKDRVSAPAFLAEFDVVVTTYNMLAAADEGFKKDLHKIRWRRIVLDEGHVIRNRNSKQTKSICALNAERHWVVSGTPIQNSIDDLYSLMAFMKFAPFSEYEWFNRLIKRPLKQNIEVGKNTLKLFMNQCCLRRNKTMKFNGVSILDLPPCNIFLHTVDFKYEEEKTAYNSLNAEFEKRFNEFADANGDHSYAHILEILIRLRQVCCHPSLIGDRKLLIDKTAAKAFESFKQNPKDPKYQRLLSILLEHIEDDCAICLDSMTKPGVTQCGHFFCLECIRDVIKIQQGSPCPMCRAKLSLNDLLELPPTLPSTQDDPTMASQDHDLLIDSLSEDTKIPTAVLSPSAKIDALLHLLRTALAKDSTTKAIVFSQWSKMLDIVEPFLRQQGISFVRFDGSLTPKARTTAIAKFKDPQAGVSVFLATLKSAGVGLNLVEANLVILTDPWWNAAVENQATDRCYRLGQTREVNVFRLVMKDTVEERVLAIQDRKRKLVGDAFGDQDGGGRRSGGGATRFSRMEDLRVLLGRTN